MNHEDVLIGTLLDEAALTLEQVCRVGGVSREWLDLRLQAGLLHTGPAATGERRFGGRELRRVREMARVERCFDATPELAALVVDLIEEIEGLRARLGVRA